MHIDHIEMDQLFWKPNWQMASDEEFFFELGNILEKNEAWILDGNYSRTIPIKWKRVESVIWLDYSFMRTFLQALKRAIYRSISKKELWVGTGNKETFRKSFFSRDSIILWTIKTHKKVRARYENLMNDDDYSTINFIRFRTPREANNFLRNERNKRTDGSEIAI